MAEEVSGDITEALEWAKTLTLAAAELVEIDDVRVAVLADGVDSWRTEIIDTEKYRPHPRRKAGEYAVRDVGSLIAYINRHKTAGTIAWADISGGIRCVLNAHEPSDAAGSGDPDFDRDTAYAGWGDHVVSLRRQRTVGYAAWLAKSGQWLKQQEFAEFLEDRIGEINDPPGADLLEIAQFFQAHTTIAVTSARQLSNGQLQVQYVEDIKESGGANGNTKVPTDFRLVLRPYMDSAGPAAAGQPDPDQIVTEAKLRYRIGSGNEAGQIKFMFKLSEDLALQIEGLHNAAIERVRAETGVPVLLQG